jgi:MFS family permease
MNKKNNFILILVTSLGYFVDIYDLVIFSIVRIPSLKALNFLEDEIFSKSVTLINYQNFGLLIGSFFWGFIGDHFGRRKVLLGSILLFSTATLFNGFIDVFSFTKNQILIFYKILRFISGFGLSGELGAAITLISEILPKEKRSMATAIVAACGVLGAITASLVCELTKWQTTYIVGGILGYLLLLTRTKVDESDLFINLKKNLSAKNFFVILKNKNLFLKYLFFIMIGIPIWFIVGVIVPFTPELAKNLNSSGVVHASYAVMFSYIGGTIGDIFAGTLSHFLKNRKKVIFTFILLNLITIIIFLSLKNQIDKFFYIICFILGFTSGYWAILLSYSVENFGTNIRTTISSTIPTFVRASIIPLSQLLLFLTNKLSLKFSVLIIITTLYLASIICLKKIPETFGKDLNYIEK